MHLLAVLLLLLLKQWCPLTAAAQKTTVTESESTYFMKKGVCLWSHGRSGSGTIAQTIKNSIDIDFCKHVKEGFRFQYPRLKFLARCLQTRREQQARSPPMRLTHVKPRHVTHSPRQVATSFSEKVQLVRDFMVNLKAAGFGALIVHRRHNTLAMLISDFELKFKRKRVLYKAFEEAFTDTVRIIQYNYLILEIGYQEALKQNIPVIETNFTAITADDSCQEYVKIFNFLNQNNFGIPPYLANHCVKVDSHVSSKKPRQNNALEVRVGNATASRIKGALLGTPYEWMLDLSAKDWPTTTVKGAESSIFTTSLQNPLVESGSSAEGGATGVGRGVLRTISTNPCRDIRRCMPETDADMSVLVSA